MSMKFILLAGLVLGSLGVFVFWCCQSSVHASASSAPDPLAQFSDDELQTAALRVLDERPECHDSWFGGTVAECDAALQQVANLRVKYASYQPVRMRKAIMSWLDYFEHQAKESREDCVTQKSRRELDEYRAERNTEQARTNQVLDKLRTHP
jgi:hypothetical protein